MKKFFYLFLIVPTILLFSFCSTNSDDQTSQTTVDDSFLLDSVEKNPPKNNTPKEDVKDVAEEEVVKDQAKEEEVEPVVVQKEEKERQKKEIITEARMQGLTFDFNSAKLIESKHKSLLKQMVSDIKELKPLDVTVEGHCDERGSNEYNDVLGKKRADSVGFYIKQHTGYESKSVSFGKRKPIIKDVYKIKDKAQRMKAHGKNRRVEVVAKFAE